MREGPHTCHLFYKIKSRSQAAFLHEDARQRQNGCEQPNRQHVALDGRVILLVELDTEVGVPVALDPHRVVVCLGLEAVQIPGAGGLIVSQRLKVARPQM